MTPIVCPLCGGYGWLPKFITSREWYKMLCPGCHGMRVL